MLVGNSGRRFTYLIAKHEGGTFILRIEDPQEREVEGAVELIIRRLNRWARLRRRSGQGGDYGLHPVRA
jgi:glutamyl-tRNA synthetase